MFTLTMLALGMFIGFHVGYWHAVIHDPIRKIRRDEDLQHEAREIAAKRIQELDANAGIPVADKYPIADMSHPS